MSVVLAVFAFGALVIIHELGHFLVARWSGMRVHRFSFGFGPALYRWTRGETEYRISALPLGGYVSIAGMDPSDPHRGEADSYASKPAWVRLATIAAGPMMNYFFAFLLAAGLFATVGQDVPALDTAQVGAVSPGSPAQTAGLQTGDTLVAIDGAPVKNFEDVVAAVRGKAGVEVALTVERAGERLELRATPVQRGDRAILGITPPTVRERMALGASIAAGASFVWRQNAAIVTSLGRMITGREKAELSGPLGIAQVMTEQARRGLVWLLRISAVLSVALALFNFLPLPALDGGRLAFLAWEIVTRRPVNQRVEQTVHAIGLMLLLGLVLLVTVGDIGKLLGR